MLKLCLAALKNMALITAIISLSVQEPDCQTSIVVLLSEKMTISLLAILWPQVSTAAHTANNSRTLMWQMVDGFHWSGHPADTQ